MIQINGQFLHGTDAIRHDLQMRNDVHYRNTFENQCNHQPHLFKSEIKPILGNVPKVENTFKPIEPIMPIMPKIENSFKPIEPITPIIPKIESGFKPFNF